MPDFSRGGASSRSPDAETTPTLPGECRVSTKGAALYGLPATVPAKTGDLPCHGQETRVQRSGGPSQHKQRGEREGENTAERSQGSVILLNEHWGCSQRTTLSYFFYPRFK